MVPVGDDNPSRDERWFDDLVHDLRSCGHEEVHLGFSVDRHAAEQKHVTHALAQLGTAGFADDHGLPGPERLAEQLDLRRLARALDTLERDEEPLGHGVERA